MGSLQVPHAASSAGLVRRALAAELATLGVSPQVVDDAALVMSELMGNAIRHGSPRSDGIRVAWWLSNGVVHLEVCDGGDGPVAVSARTARGSSDDEVGRGLSIVAMLSSDWGVEQHESGASVWAQLPLAGAAPAVAAWDALPPIASRRRASRR